MSGEPEKGREPEEPGEKRHDPDERSGRVFAQGRVGRDDLSGRLMMDFEPGPGEDDGEDELALRRLLHGAVAGLEPSTEALDHLRHAVPARRARKRQALVGAAAAAVLIGTAVPALVHVAGSPGVTTANPALAGHGEQAQGGTGAEAEGPATTKAPSVKVSPTTEPTKDSPGKNGDHPGPKGTPTASGTAAGAGRVPSCARGTLQSAGAYNNGPDAGGVVYGGFTIVNASAEACVVDGDGLVGVATIGSADPNRIAVARHSNGDPATGLPDPSAESASVLLKPGGSYQVKFAWVPSETCPALGGSIPPPTPTPTEPSPTPTEPTPTPTEPTPTPTEPTPTPTEGGEGTDPGGTETGGGGTGTETGTGTDSGVSTQLMRAEPGQGSVTVSHTAEPGDPTVTTVLADACAGTVYRTGLLKN